MEALNDRFVEDLLNDDEYKICRNGEILKYLKRGGQRLVISYLDRKGYEIVRYKRKHLYVHRIMYRKFIGKLDKGLTINHKDGVPTNNDPNNLELLTQGKNNEHRFRVLKKPAIKGNAKITEAVAVKIRQERQRGRGYKDLCKKYKLSKSTISYIINRRTWV